MAGNPRGNPQNLKPWRKGQSGNPRGSKPGRSSLKISDALKRLLATKPNSEFTPRTRSDEVAFRLYKSACQGDSIATREILDRTEGRVTDKLQVDQGPVDIVVRYEKQDNKGNWIDAEAAVIPSKPLQLPTSEPCLVPKNDSEGDSGAEPIEVEIIVPPERRLQPAAIERMIKDVPEPPEARTVTLPDLNPPRFRHGFERHECFTCTHFGEDNPRGFPHSHNLSPAYLVTRRHPLVGFIRHMRSPRESQRGDLDSLVRVTVPCVACALLWQFPPTLSRAARVSSVRVQRPGGLV